MNYGGRIGPGPRWSRADASLLRHTDVEKWVVLPSVVLPVAGVFGLPYCFRMNDDRAENINPVQDSKEGIVMNKQVANANNVDWASITVKTTAGGSSTHSTKRRIITGLLAVTFIVGAMFTSITLAIPAHAAPTAAGLVKTAESQLGRSACEVNSNGVKMDYCTTEWCAYFVKWVWKVNGVNVNGIDGYARSFSDAARGTSKNGSILHDKSIDPNYIPQPGDAIVISSPSYPYYENSNQHSAAHVGIVTGTAGGRVQYIDGNASTAGGEIAKTYDTAVVHEQEYNSYKIGYTVSSGRYIAAYVTPGGLTIAPVTPAAAATITSATPSPSIGTPTTAFTYTVVTNTAATLLKFSFNGNSTSYTVSSGGILSPSAWGGTTVASVTTSGTTRTWTISKDKLSAGDRMVTVTAYNSANVASASKSFAVTVTQPTTTAATISSAVPSPTSGTTDTAFTYTVVTNTAAAKLNFTFNGSSTVYSVNASGVLTPSLWGGTTVASVFTSSSARTWTISKDKLSAGNRTITVTAYNSAGTASAAKSFAVTVTQPAPAAAISAATVSPTSGTTSTLFTYLVTTTTAVTELRFTYNGNSTVYKVTSAGVLTPSLWGGTTTASVTNSGTTRTWAIAKDQVGVGNRTITVTAYNSAGTSVGSKTMSVSVVKSAAPKIISATASPTSGTTATKFSYSVVTNTDTWKLRFSYNGNSTIYELNKAGVLTPAKWGGTTTANILTSGSNLTWIISNDQMGAGNRSIMVVAYNAEGLASAPVLIYVTVK